NNLGDLRYYAHWGLDETELGWSSMLTEYLFYLLPFSYAHKAKYLMYGNENSVDHFYYSKEVYFKERPILSFFEASDNLKSYVYEFDETAAISVHTGRDISGIAFDGHISIFVAGISYRNEKFDVDSWNSSRIRSTTIELGLTF
ncbi:MAG: hypothetical protein AABZ31_12765, partial [Bdellovibrionota bacterium]